MSESDDTAPRRLIIPGAEPEPTERPRGGISGAGVTPPAGPAGSRIILPPGVAPVADDIPEYPRLRPLVLMPISDGQREMILVQDPLGVIAGQPVLGIDALGLLQLFDGTTSLTDITASLMRESKDLRVANMVRDFVGKLDQMLMLDSPRFQAAWQEMRDAYHPLEVRQAVFGGRSYPAEPGELATFLDAQFAEAKTWDPPATPSAPARALLAPHLDPGRAGAAMARAFLELDPAGAEPLRVVIYGTGHSLMGDLFALTRKHFETPFGKVLCDTAFVDEIAAALGESAYRSELAHREEHAIEFQVVYLRHRLGSRPFTIVPILCGGFHTLLDDGLTPPEHAEFEALIHAVRAAERKLGGRTVHLAGRRLLARRAALRGSRRGRTDADRGRDRRPRGDRGRPARRRGRVVQGDRLTRRRDADLRLRSDLRHAALCRARRGRLLRYERSDEPDGSLVSIAAMAW